MTTFAFFAKTFARKFIPGFAGLIPLVYFGKYLDDSETLRLTRFRDKSALYGFQLKPGDAPSWP